LRDRLNFYEANKKGEDNMRGALFSCQQVGYIALLLVLLLSRQAGARVPRHPNHPLVVAYFGESALCGTPPFHLKELVKNGGAGLLDQLNYSHASVQGGRCSLGDFRADIETPYTAENSVDGKADQTTASFRGYFHQLKLLKKQYPNLKLLISLEGSAMDFRYDALPEHRKAFVSSCVETFLMGRFAPGILAPGMFDGVDLDWEYPQGEDAKNFTALLKEFRRQMNTVQRGLLVC
jgi:chitinase